MVQHFLHTTHMEDLATGRAADIVVAIYFFIADGTVEVQMVVFNGRDESGVALHFYGSLIVLLRLLLLSFSVKSISIFSLNIKMPIVYCLQNESFKENIVCVGITESLSSLNQMVASINKSFLPTPYMILFTNQVYNRIDIVYSLLTKFGRHIHGNFFEIAPDTVAQLFALIHTEEAYANEIGEIGEIDQIYANAYIQEKYRIIQGETEYIIPKGDEPEVVYTLPEVVYTLPKPYYDRLFAYDNEEL
jgi:hypothetical protein